MEFDPPPPPLQPPSSHFSPSLQIVAPVNQTARHSFDSNSLDVGRLYFPNCSGAFFTKLLPDFAECS